MLLSCRAAFLLSSDNWSNLVCVDWSGNTVVCTMYILCIYTVIRGIYMYMHFLNPVCWWTDMVHTCIYIVYTLSCSVYTCTCNVHECFLMFAITIIHHCVFLVHTHLHIPCNILLFGMSFVIVLVQESNILYKQSSAMYIPATVGGLLSWGIFSFSCTYIAVHSTHSVYRGTTAYIRVYREIWGNATGKLPTCCSWYVDSWTLSVQDIGFLYNSIVHTYYMGCSDKYCTMYTQWSMMVTENFKKHPWILHVHEYTRYNSVYHVYIRCTVYTKINAYIQAHTMYRQSIYTNRPLISFMFMYTLVQTVYMLHKHGKYNLTFSWTCISWNKIIDGVQIRTHDRVHTR